MDGIVIVAGVVLCVGLLCWVKSTGDEIDESNRRIEEMRRKWG